MTGIRGYLPELFVKTDDGLGMGETLASFMDSHFPSHSSGHAHLILSELRPPFICHRDAVGLVPSRVRIPLLFQIKKEDILLKYVFFFGGETGIRTLETLTTPTRFPVVRLRPTQPSLHSADLLSFVFQALTILA